MKEDDDFFVWLEKENQRIEKKMLDFEKRLLEIEEQSNHLAKIVLATYILGVALVTIACLFGDMMFDDPIFLLNFFPNFFIIDTAPAFYANSIIVSFFLFYTIIICSCVWLCLVFTREKRVAYYKMHDFIEISDERKRDDLRLDLKNRFYLMIISLFIFYFVYSQMDGVFVLRPISEVSALWKISAFISVFFPPAIAGFVFNITPRSLSIKIGNYLHELFFEG